MEGAYQTHGGSYAPTERSTSYPSHCANPVVTKTSPNLPSPVRRSGSLSACGDRRYGPTSLENWDSAVLGPHTSLTETVCPPSVPFADGFLTAFLGLTSN